MVTPLVFLRCGGRSELLHPKATFRWTIYFGLEAAPCNLFLISRPLASLARANN